MKKRKPPIILATVLIIMVGAGFAYNSSALQKPGAEGQQAPPPQQDAPAGKVTDARAPETKDAISARMKGSLGDKPGEQAENRRKPHGAPGGGSTEQPSIKVSKPAPYVPTKDPNRTSQQWYAPESERSNSDK